jgi:amidase
MISMDEYMHHDGIGLAELVQRGEVSASELLEAAIARAEAVNPQIGALVIPFYDRARERARHQLRGPFAGVPMLIKDLYQDYAGVLSTFGSRALRRISHTPALHSEIVQRWLSTGAVIFGRTNTPEFGAKGITEPEAWGPTRNPWDLTRSSGGSSGGSAAAVAAGIVPFAGASDGGGSIRIPSASTGLFGLKPGRGRTPSGPGTGETIHGAAMNHIVSRSVRDSACMLDATHGPEPGSLCRLAPPEWPYLSELERDPTHLRIAFSARSPLGMDVDPAAVDAVDKAARLLENLGHHVEPAEPPIDGSALARDFLTIWFAQLAVHVKNTRRDHGAHDSDFELDTLAMEAVGSTSRATDYIASYMRWNEYGYRLATFLGRYDVYMTPTLALAPPRIGQVKPPFWAERLMRMGIPLGLSRLIPLAPRTIEQVTLEHLRGVPFTQLANVTGVPAMSVPLFTFPSGLPLGMHFLSEHGSEGRLIALAAQLERALPWAQRRPELRSGVT